jgi:hypothetical protein
LARADLGIEALVVYQTFFQKLVIKQGKKQIPLQQASKELVSRLIALFEADKEGNRPYLSKNDIFKDAPMWFFEHFDGETGRGLGATHQNGWTAVIGKLIHHEGQALYTPKKDTMSS